MLLLFANPEDRVSCIKAHMLFFIYTEPIKRPPRTEDFSQITSKSSQAVPLADIPPRSLSHISETSRDEQSWAITQQYQSTHGARTPSAVSFNNNEPK